MLTPTGDRLARWVTARHFGFSWLKGTGARMVLLESAPQEEPLRAIYQTAQTVWNIRNCIRQDVILNVRLGLRFLNQMLMATAAPALELALRALRLEECTQGRRAKPPAGEPTLWPRILLPAAPKAFAQPESRERGRARFPQSPRQHWTAAAHPLPRRMVRVLSDAVAQAWGPVQPGVKPLMARSAGGDSRAQAVPERASLYAAKARIRPRQIALPAGEVPARQARFLERLYGTALLRLGMNAAIPGPTGNSARRPDQAFRQIAEPAPRWPSTAGVQAVMHPAAGMSAAGVLFTGPAAKATQGASVLRLVAPRIYTARTAAPASMVQKESPKFPVAEPGAGSAGTQRLSVQAASAARMAYAPNIGPTAIRRTLAPPTPRSFAFVPDHRVLPSREALTTERHATAFGGAVPALLDTSRAKAPPAQGFTKPAVHDPFSQRRCPASKPSFMAERAAYRDLSGAAAVMEVFSTGRFAPAERMRLLTRFRDRLRTVPLPALLKRANLPASAKSETHAPPPRGFEPARTELRRERQTTQAQGEAVPDIPTVVTRRMEHSVSEQTQASKNIAINASHTLMQPLDGDLQGALAKAVEQIDIGRISDRVYRQLETRLRQEKERRGMW